MKKIKFPKGWNRFSIDEQRMWVAKERETTSNYLDELGRLSRALIKQTMPITIKMQEDDRPDLVTMK